VGAHTRPSVSAYGEGNGAALPQELPAAGDVQTSVEDTGGCRGSGDCSKGSGGSRAGKGTDRSSDAKSGGGSIYYKKQTPQEAIRLRIEREERERTGKAES